MLNSTPYSNISRVVSGAVVLYPNDLIILCDTSTIPTTMTLQEIPANNWQTTWKLYILDNSNNAAAQSITISAPSGYTINNASSLVINTNGGGVTITIASNTDFFGQVSPLPSSGGGGTITAVTGTAPVAVSAGTTPVVSMPAASGSVDGYLSAANFTAFNSKVTGVTGTAPIAVSAGTSPVVSIPDAGADGTTKGAATFTANDFTASSGVIGIDYVNGQAASASAKGFLTSANWSTFNGKSEVISASNTGGVVVATCTNFRFKTTDFTTVNTSGVADISIVGYPQFLAQYQPPDLARVAPASANTIFTAGTTLPITEVYDDGNNYNPISGIYTTSAAGRYNVSFWAHYSKPVGGEWISGMFTAGIMTGSTNGQYVGNWATVTQDVLHIDVSGCMLGLDLAAGATLCMVVLNQLDSAYVTQSGDVVRFSVQRVK